MLSSTALQLVALCKTMLGAVSRVTSSIIAVILVIIN